MILLKRYWYKSRLKYLINKADYCDHPKMKKDINKKIYSLHLRLNEIEQFNMSELHGNETYNR